MERERLIPKHGGYRKLKTYQLAELIYDVTVRFCDRYIDRRSRTHDQMVQAARSGKQNIAEGSMASGTSKSTELKLTGVARASLEELKLDYEDFLRQRRLPQWPDEDPRRQELIDLRPKMVDDFAAWVRAVREGGRQSGPGGRSGRGSRLPSSTMSTLSTKSTKSTRSTRSTRSTVPTSAEVSANGTLVLLRVVLPLLRRQLASQGEAFEREGGFRERLYRVRSARRAST
jgi:four helix bundle suffix protein